MRVGIYFDPTSAGELTATRLAITLDTLKLGKDFMLLPSTSGMKNNHFSGVRFRPVLTECGVKFSIVHVEDRQYDTLTALSVRNATASISCGVLINVIDSRAPRTNAWLDRYMQLEKEFSFRKKKVFFVDAADIDITALTKILKRVIDQESAA